MTDWQIQVPHRSRDQLLVAAAGERLTGDEGRVARALLLQAVGRHGADAKVGDLLAEIEDLEPHERRRLLDDARAEAAQPSIASAEAERRMVEASARARRGAWSPLQMCHADGCTVFPTNVPGGSQAPVHVRKWWCEQHRHLGAPGDMEPPPSPWKYSPSGAIVEVDPTEAIRERAAAESRARRLEAEQGVRAEEHREAEERRRAHDAALDAVTPSVFGGKQG